MRVQSNPSVDQMHTHRRERHLTPHTLRCIREWSRQPAVIMQHAGWELMAVSDHHPTWHQPVLMLLYS